MHEILEFEDQRVCVVQGDDSSWNGVFREGEYHLLRHGEVQAKIQRVEDKLVLLPIGECVVELDGKMCCQKGVPVGLAESTVVELKTEPSGVFLTTKGSLPALLCRRMNWIGPFEEAARYEPYGHAANAISVWNDTVVSPDCLQPMGRAIYEEIVQITGREYRDRV